jgi:hypothetical protein
MCACVHVCMYVCMHVYMYVCSHKHTHMYVCSYQHIQVPKRKVHTRRQQLMIQEFILILDERQSQSKSGLSQALLACVDVFLQGSRHGCAILRDWELFFAACGPHELETSSPDRLSAAHWHMTPSQACGARCVSRKLEARAAAKGFFFLMIFGAEHEMGWKMLCASWMLGRCSIFSRLKIVVCTLPCHNATVNDSELGCNQRTPWQGIYGRPGGIGAICTGNYDLLAA